ncbi:MAG: hypothetical protein R2867_28820 [Caldilineaceae bacterium]
MDRSIYRYIQLEALPQRRQSLGVGTPLWEEPVAAALLCIDPRDQQRSGLLTLLHCANDEETVDRLRSVAQEELARQGGGRLLGPLALSPQLASGVLENYFHVVPPLHTVYNPPYLPELLSSSLTPWQSLSLFQLKLPVQPNSTSKPTVPDQHISVIPLTAPMAQAASFLPLWQIASPTGHLFPLPDPIEVAFIWDWLTVWPWAGWVAICQDQPLGFVLLQPDLAQQSRTAGGGHNPLWALWLRWRSQQPVSSGRLLYGGILPDWQGRGLEELLWQKTLRHAVEQGWSSLTIGPLAVDIADRSFLCNPPLTNIKPEAQQRYVIYTNE